MVQPRIETDVPVRPWMRMAARLAEEWRAEGVRWPLWLPVFLGAGIGLYFLLPAEPPSWIGMAALANAVLLGMAFRHRAWTRPVAAAVLAAAFGFAVAQWRTATVEAPVLPKRMAGEITGRVAALDAREGRVRATLDRLAIEGLAPETTPRRVRIRLSGSEASLAPGQWIAVRAVLSPPSPPVATGEYDFQRHLYFLGIGATGFAVERAPRVIDPPDEASPGGFAIWLASQREAVHRRIVEAVPGPAGLIASALVTGKQGDIPPAILQAMRDSGLAHLLAISGQNISLVALFVFGLVRGAGALVPPLALRHPIKKWAAMAAFLAALAYLLLAGADVPTQRAVAMIGLVVLAVLVDRTAISMRLVAWAGALVLLIAPEALVGASFQLSFAAVVALIAAYERLPGGAGTWVHRGARSPGIAWRAMRYLGLVLFSSAIASAATAPFAVYHFNRFPVYGLGANLLAVPLTGAWIMPWGLAAMMLYPLGLEDWALAPMGWGIEAMIALAERVASWPSAVLLLPSPSAGGLALVSLGGLWLCLWQRRWRLIGLAAIAAGLATMQVHRAPDVLVSGDGALMAVRAPDGAMVLSTHGSGRFAAQRWFEDAGLEGAAPWTIRDAPDEVGDWLACDAAGCLYRARGRAVALVRDGTALAEDCTSADVVVATLKVPAACRARAQVVDRIDLWRLGAHAVWLDARGLARIESVRGRQGERPWVPKRGGPLPEAD